MSTPRRLAWAAAAAVLVTTSVTVGTSFGAQRAKNVYGIVYHDADNNGVRGPNEPGIPDVVITAGASQTVTGADGAWKLRTTRGATVMVMTGWYRSQCDTTTCAAGPGVDQDFKSSYQAIKAPVRSKTRRLDVGLVPDWPGGYPIPQAQPIPSSEQDVAVRVSFVSPSGAAGDSNCFRTTELKNRACAIGDQPSFLVQIYNEGTSAIADPAGHLVLPTGTSMVSIRDAASNHPALQDIAVGDFDPTTRSIPFEITGQLPPAAMAVYQLTLVVTADAQLTTTFQTRGSYPNEVGARITSVQNDVEGDRCTEIANCPWGRTDRQIWPDNSDTAGFAIVAADEDTATPIAAIITIPPATTAPPVVTQPPTTAPPVVTQPPTTTSMPPIVTIPPATTSTTTAPAPTTTAPTTTTPPTTPPTQPPAECQVSDLLVPSCGVWLGASTPSRNGTYDYVAGLTEYENVAQNTPDILHFYKTGAMPFPKAWEIAQSERPGKQRSLLMYNWKPSKTATWRQIANGAADSEIATVAANLKKYPNKLFLNIYHEPEDNVRTSTSSGMTAADYADMYRYVVDKLSAHGVTNAVYVWNPMGYYGWRQHLDDLYPGNNYVDWVCYDPYVKDNIQSDFGELVNRDRPDINWPGFYNWATAKAPGKPLAMCEWGVDLITNSNPAGFLQGDTAAMLAKYPMLKAVIYWNDIDKVNARIDENTTKGKALGTAYRNFANQPIFNQMTP